MTDSVILVDSEDRQIGVAEKIEAHRRGLLHRAFSVFVFNARGEMLLQKRADEKYHSAGLWSNACCSHPRPGETVRQASVRRLREEMGFDCALKKAFSFTYRAVLDGELIEHEFDHVLIGRYDGVVRPNAAEVLDYRWLAPEPLLHEVDRSPDRYTVWFKIALPRVMQFVATEGRVCHGR